MSAAHTMTKLAESARETERAERELMEREPSFVTAVCPSSAASAAASPSKAEDSSLSSANSVEGRVFRRLQRFQLLPSELKAQSDMVATYLLAPKVRSRVFEQRKHWWQHPLHLAKAGQGAFVRGRKLLKAILGYLLLSNAANTTLLDAQQLAEALVLNGFLSPVREAPSNEDEQLGELYVLDDNYYELVAPGATAVIPTPSVVASATTNSSSASSLPRAVISPVQPQGSPTHCPKQVGRHGGSLSVWAVTDGATRAGFVQRRFGRHHVRNLLKFASKEKRCYAVVNKTKHHALALFESDVARRELVRLDLPSATVEYYAPSDAAAPSYALKVCGDVGGRRDGTDSSDAIEMLVLQSKAEQEQWLLALVDAGATFLETNPSILSFAASSASLYSLRDSDASGNPFCLSTLRGHAGLLVNVASGSCNTSAEQLTELAELSTKYEAAGLKVLAFPSAQFGDSEFASDEELADHLRTLFGVRFPVLATRDVNGPNARDAMLFCKTRLPGSASSAANTFIENDLVKFLVGRDGKPFKRYGPSVLPCSMEADIQLVLQSLSTPTPTESS